MMTIQSMLSVIGGVVVLTTGFLLPPVHSFSNIQPTQRTSTVLMHMVPPISTSSTVDEIEAESEQLRKEIEELRKEALSRLEALSEQLGLEETSSGTDTSKETAIADDKDLLPTPMPITFTDSTTPETKKKKNTAKGIANLLDETSWKISLSIGREPGTWMPKDWGKSGQRLNLSFTADFTPSQLFDRDDFFRGGYTNAKVLNVESNEIILGPSLSEGQRTFKVKNGGWQVTRGDGPMGTDLLRFFVEVDEVITHTGSDVYIPKGRIYCSCGYFPFINTNKDGMKDNVKDEIKQIEKQIIQLQKKKDDIKNPFNLEGIKLSSEIFKLNQDLDMLNQRLSFAMARQPDKQLLRYSPDGDVGLTKEGGVCCEVKKGPVVEYHILGRFGIASAQKEEN
jgi:chaperonin cofactor prefoldin